MMSASATKYMCPARPGFECVFQEKNSEEVCKYCGRTGRRTIYTGAAKMFDPEDEKNLTSDTGKYLGPPSTKMGEVFTSNVSVLNPGYKARDRSIVTSMKATAKEQARERCRHKLEDQCRQMELSKRTTDDCLLLFEKYAEKGTIQKNQVTIIILGILFHGCKKGENHLTVSELAKITSQSEENVRKGIKLIERKCEVSQDRSKVESSGFIRKFCFHLAMSPSEMNVFVPNAMIVDDYIRGYLEGRKPNTVAAADIALAVKWFHGDESKYSLDAIATTAGVSQSTLRKSIGDALAGMERAKVTPSQIVDYARSLSGDHGEHES